MPRILVIDDDAQIVGILRTFFESHGFEVDTAMDGVEGQQHFRENPADIVLTDIIMPEREGLETIRELRRDHPDVRIIAMSGGGRVGTADYLRVAELYGVRRTFKKPFELEEVLVAVQELLAE